MKVWLLFGLTLTGCVAVMDSDAVRVNHYSFMTTKGCEPFMLTNVGNLPDIPQIDPKLLTNRDKIEEILVASIKEHRRALLEYHDQVAKQQATHLASCSP